VIREFVFNGGYESMLRRNLLAVAVAIPAVLAFFPANAGAG
jgi:hypothetical protein